MKRRRLYGNGYFSLLLIPVIRPFTRAAFVHREQLRRRPSSSIHINKSRISHDGDYFQDNQKSPFPAMPSQVFVTLAQSQFELLAHSLYYPSPMESEKIQKIKSIALYLPQENSSSGQLEFLPAIVYPSSTNERIFIASDAESGIAPTIPQTLSKLLPGFTHAKNLIPTYPFLSSRFSADSSYDSTSTSSSPTSVAIGSIEEVMYDSSTGMRLGNAPLSLPLYQGSYTLGILLVWPASPPPFYSPVGHTFSWTEEDKKQISRAGRSLALALSLDNDRNLYQSRNEQFRIAVSDTLHQIKNPLQAVRTFAKLLQRQIATGQMKESAGGENFIQEYGLSKAVGNTTSYALSNYESLQRNIDLMKLADSMILQSVRAADLLLPVNDMIDEMETKSSTNQRLALPSRLEENENQITAGKLVLQDKLPEEKSLWTYTNREGGSSGTVAWMKKGTKLQLKMTFIPDILEPLLQSESAIALDRGILLEVDGIGIESELPGVLVCPQALQEALINILDNALTYVTMGYQGRANIVNPSPHVRIRIRPNDPPLESGVTILVEDNGPGVPTSEHHSIFTRGYRSKRTNQASGSGLGLDISRSLIEWMGGTLDIIDVDDSLKGAVFRVTLFRNPLVKGT
jgi:signal transduction histidine kinase